VPSCARAAASVFGAERIGADEYASGLLLFQDKEERNLELSLETVLPPLIRLASPAKKRYAYKTAEPASDGSCPDCTKDLTVLVGFQSFNIRSTNMR